MLCDRGTDSQLSFCSCLAGAGVRALSINKYAASHTKANQSSLNCSLSFHSNAILANGQRIQGIIRLAPPRPSSLDSRISCRIPSRLASFLFFPSLAFLVSRFCLRSFLSRLAFVLSPILSRFVFVLSCLVLLVSWYLGRPVSWSLGLRSLDPMVSLASWHAVCWSLGSLVPWPLCTLVSWPLGPLASWSLGLSVSWSLDVWVSGLSPHLVSSSLCLWSFGLLAPGLLVFFSLGLLVSLYLGPLGLSVSRSLGHLVSRFSDLLVSWPLGLLASGLLAPFDPSVSLSLVV